MHCNAIKLFQSRIFFLINFNYYLLLLDMIYWLTLEELASYLKMSRARLYQVAQRGEIPAVKLGRTWRFDRDRIDAWLGQQKGVVDVEDYPWFDSFRYFIKQLQGHFQQRFASLWIYGSWVRGEARPDSDVDLLVVLEEIKDFSVDFNTISSLAYQSTFGQGKTVVFSVTLTDQKTFLAGMEPLLLNIRREGKQAA